MMQRERGLYNTRREGKKRESRSETRPDNVHRACQYLRVHMCVAACLSTKRTRGYCCLDCGCVRVVVAGCCPRRVWYLAAVKRDHAERRRGSVYLEDVVHRRLLRYRQTDRPQTFDRSIAASARRPGRAGPGGVLSAPTNVFLFCSPVFCVCVFWSWQSVGPACACMYVHVFVS